MPSTATVTQHTRSSISLQPHIAIINARRKSSAYSTTSPSSTTLPSPSIVAARAFYLEHAAPSEGGFGRWESLNESPLSARRLSVLDTSHRLTTQLENFTFSSPIVGSQNLEVKSEDELISKTDNVAVSINKEEVVTSPVLERRTSSITPRAAEILSRVPFEYTHNHLREWGYAYLGNTTTADVFVDAVALRRDSAQESQKLTTIRARVFPASKDRKPFLIQRDFDVEALREKISSPMEYKRFPRCQLRRRSRERSGSVSSHSSHHKNVMENEHLKSALPIHISYALHYLPILGAIMLSGHVQKRDTISLLLPHPECWREVVRHIYIGDTSLLTPEVKENVRYCGGWTC